MAGSTCWAIAPTLAGSNTYRGITTITAGTLQFGTGVVGQDGSIGNSSGVVNNAFAVFDLTGTNVVPGQFSGNGALAVIGPGSLVLTNSLNAFSGGIFVDNGTLQFGNGLPGQDGFSSKALLGGILDQGRVVLNLTGTEVITCPISGSGALTVVGPGQLVISWSANAFGGGTIISNGFVELTSPGAILSGTDLSVGSELAKFSPVVPAAETTAVPEPGTWALATAGTASLLLVYGRRRCRGRTVGV